MAKITPNSHRSLRGSMGGRLLLCTILVLLQFSRFCDCTEVNTGSNTVEDNAKKTDASTARRRTQGHGNPDMDIVASGSGEYTFLHTTSRTTTDAPSLQGEQVEEAEPAQGQPLEGPGCRFANGDGSETTFLEGQSMGTYRMIESCANNVPEAFPCYCISGAPDQTVCPYCFYLDSFNQNICGRSGEITGVLHPNRTLINCQCTVSVDPFGSSYDVKISSNCDMVDLTTSVPAGPAPSTPVPTSGFLVDTTTNPPVFVTTPITNAPVATAAPITNIPITTMAPITNPPVPVATPGPTAWETLAPNFIFPSPGGAVPVPAPVIPSPGGAVPVPAPLPTATVVPVPPPPPTTSLGDITLPFITYQPGNLTTRQEGLVLSEGLSVRILARTGERVTYEATGTDTGGANVVVARQNMWQSTDEFHGDPDGAAVFLDNRPNNPGGYIWVSNSEKTDGGVGAVTFNKQGQIIDYKRIQSGTLWNCNGGKTPWGTWVTAEEDTEDFNGRLWQVDPYGVRQPEPLTLGSDGGAWEAFAYDVRDLNVPRFFATEDDSEGALRRWTPDTADWGTDPWSMLHGPGLTEYLVLVPNFENGDGIYGTFYWTTDENEGRDSANDYYQNSEGIDFHAPILTFVCKGDFLMFRLNLDTGTYTMYNTQSGLFDGEPDQVNTILQDDGTAWLYFSEDYGRVAGVHARDEEGNFFTILEGPEYEPETTGITFSPDGLHMYFTFQEDGVMFDVTRNDGHSFHASTVNLKPRLTENPRRYRNRKR